MKVLLVILVITMLISGCKEEGGDSSSSNLTPGANPIPADQLWVGTTPAGINIVSDKGTLSQYEYRWYVEGFHWADIDWEALDEQFYTAKEYYCNVIGWDCKNIGPYQLTIRIMPHAPLDVCFDAETPSAPYEIHAFINGAWQCWDGWEWHGTIYTHLGDDPGQDHETIYSEDPLSSQEFRAWQETSVPHELMHFFQYMSGLPYSETLPSPPIVVYIIKLPDEEVEDGLL